MTNNIIWEILNVSTSNGNNKIKIVIHRIKRVIFGIKYFSKTEILELMGVFESGDFHTYYFRIFERFRAFYGYKYTVEIDDDFWYNHLSAVTATVEKRNPLPVNHTVIAFQEKILADFIFLGVLLDEIEKTFFGSKISGRGDV